MKKPAPKKKTAARKRPAPPKESAIRLLKITMDQLERLRADAQMLLNQSAQDMKEINGLKNRLSNAEGVNRSMYARLNALEAKSPVPSAVDMKAIREQVVSLQNILDMMNFKMPTAFLSGEEVRRVRKIIAAMA